MSTELPQLDAIALAVILDSGRFTNREKMQRLTIYELAYMLGVLSQWDQRFLKAQCDAAERGAMPPLPPEWWESLLRNVKDAVLRMDGRAA